MSETDNSLPALANKSTTLKFGNEEYVFERQVTRSVLKQYDKEPFAIKCEGAIYQAQDDPEQRVTRRDAMKDAPPPELMNVVNMASGELQTLVVNKVLASELRRNYPNDGYVGKVLLICRDQAASDKRYKTYRIVELRPKASLDAKPEVAKIIDATGENEPAALDNARKRR